MINKRFFINYLTNFLKQRNPFSKRILILTNLIYPHRLIRRLKHNKSKRFNLKYFINDIPNHKSGVNIEFDSRMKGKSKMSLKILFYLILMISNKLFRKIF